MERITRLMLVVLVGAAVAGCGGAAADNANSANSNATVAQCEQEGEFDRQFGFEFCDPNCEFSGFEFCKFDSEFVGFEFVDRGHRLDAGQGCE